VVISADTAARHARAAGIRTEDEVVFLLVHGVLHLLGYDHEGPAAERRTMEAKEKEIFRGLIGAAKEKRK
jgi:probable rRNA maturation factor